MGRESEARLTEQIDAMRSKTEESGSRKVDLHVERPNERRFDGNPTSGGEVGRYTIRGRRGALSKIRGAYVNLCAEWHCERGWGCEKTQTYVEGGLMHAAASVGSPQAAESQPEKAAVGAEGGSEPMNAEALAEYLVETMTPEVRQEFALADVEASTLSEGDLGVVLKGIGLVREAGGLPMDDQVRRAVSLKREEDEQRVKAEKANSKAPAEVVLMEENKEHIKIIVAGIISDMLPVMQKLTALDPRIQRWSLANSPRFKQRILDDYMAEIRSRRKSEIGLLKAAGTFAKYNLSSQAYRSVRTVLCDLGFRHVLPTVKDLDDARKHIEKNAAVDLEVTQTEDGWFFSIRALIEMELLRMQQRVTTQSTSTRKESGARSIGHAGPEMNGWQDEIDVKITMDARRITKKTSQTEVMMHIFKRGEEGSEDSQSALCMRTVGIFQGKDSREGVQANATEFFQECQDLAVRGVVFNIKKQAFLGQLEAFSQLSEEEQVADKTADKHVQTYFPVSVKFWSPADMAAQCAILGHGCAGHHYCAHCMAHADERHLPYALRTLDEDTNFSALAHELDMHPKTLFALNTRVDHAGVQALTLQGLRDSTAMDAAARALAAARESEPEQGVSGARRCFKKAKRAPVAKYDPDEGVLKMLDGWRDPSKHSRECKCKKCVIPKGTCVRVIPRFGFSRPSDYLQQNFPALTAERCPFCALHCLMRVTESLFQQICQAAQSSSKRAELIVRMNQSLREQKINVQYKQTLKTKEWEKVTFEGHQAKALLKKDKDGKMGIERLLEAMWPGSTGDTPEWRVKEKEFGTKFVPRVVEVWKQWAVVDRLMSERFVSKLRADKVDGEDGFARFGKECREFIFRFQSMATQDFSKAYYLHTVLHHAGDFMRALEKEGMTLGMMSNSGAERRHEFGRRACRKALASNGWRKKNPEYDALPNLIVYLTLKELLMWDYGEDLISHEIARLSSEGQLPGTRTLMPHERVHFKTGSRRSLLSAAEYLQEAAAEPFDPPPCFETSNKDTWRQTLRGNKLRYELIGMKHEHDSDDEDVYSHAVAGDLLRRPKARWDPDNEPLLFSGICPACDDDGSEVDESDAGAWFDSADGLTLNSFPFPDEDEEEWVDQSDLEARDEWSDTGEETEFEATSLSYVESRRLRSEAVMMGAVSLTVPDRDEVKEQPPHASELPVARTPPVAAPSPPVAPSQSSSNSASRRPGHAPPRRRR